MALEICRNEMIVIAFREEAKAKDRRLMMELLGENAPKDESEKEEEEAPVAVHFRAKPVPEHTKQPVFQNMVRDQQRR